MAESNDDNKKIVDVAKPGESSPGATAKPVIVGHGTMIKEDPMVTANKPADDLVPDSPAQTLPKKGEKVITAPAQSDMEAKSESASKPAEQPKAAEKEVTTQEESKEEGKVSSSEQAAVDAVAEQADKDKKKKADPTDEEKARAAAIQKLIDEKKYFVSVSATRRQRKAMHSLLILLLLVIIIAIGVYLLIDAEIVDLGVKLPFEIVK